MKSVKSKMSENTFVTIRNIDREGVETWLYSDIANLMSDITDLVEWSIASQLDMLEDGIDLSLHIWSIANDYVLSRTACGYLLANCPDYSSWVASGRDYFQCSQVRKAKAILAQVEANAELRVES